MSLKNQVSPEDQYLGVDPHNIIRMQIEIARHKQDVTNMLKACDYFMELLEMKPSKKITTDTLQLDVSSSIADAIESEEKSLLMQRKEEVNESKESSKP